MCTCILPFMCLNIHQKLKSPFTTLFVCACLGIFVRTENCTVPYGDKMQTLKIFEAQNVV